MKSYLEKPGAHLFGTHPGGLHTIGTVQAGREHCATFFNCLPEEESILFTFPILSCTLWDLMIRNVTFLNISLTIM